jgi:hypothetical protein
MLKKLLERISAFIPGLGHALRGKRAKGLAVFLATVPPLAVILLLYYTHMHAPVITAFGSIDEHLRRLDVIRLRYLLASLPSAVVWVLSAVDCLSSGRKRPATQSEVMGILHG